MTLSCQSVLYTFYVLKLLSGDKNSENSIWRLLGKSVKPLPWRARVRWWKRGQINAKISRDVHDLSIQASNKLFVHSSRLQIGYDVVYHKTYLFIYFT